MPLAITLRTDPIMSRRIEDLIHFIGKQELDLEPLPDYVPHITIAVIDDNFPVIDLCDKIESVSHVEKARTITISHLGIFPGAPAFVFLAPVATRQLLNIHRRIVESLPAGSVHEHYKIGCWVPHVTIACTRKSPKDVISAVEADFRQCQGNLVALEVVRFSPVQVLASIPLALENTA